MPGKQYLGLLGIATHHVCLNRNLKPAEDRYLSSLPLILHLPDYHIFLVHAGLLPLNPTIPLNSKHQPLSHVPGSLQPPHKRHAESLPSSARFRRAVIEADSTKDGDEEAEKNKHRHRKPASEAELRTLQERMVLKTIPQNTIPFNLLNMRSLERNAPVRSKKVRALTCSCSIVV